MIISHRHRFIFLKTRKTAGTSIEIALSRICGAEDIITPIMPEDEEIRQETGGRGPQNHRLPYRAYTLKDWGRLLIKGRRLQYYNHVTAKLVKQWIGDEIWNSYFKFAVERSPYDQAISRYFWRTRDMQIKPDFESFLRALDLGLLSNWPIYTIDDQVAVDQVIQYSNLNSEFDAVIKELNLAESLSLPFSKAGFRKEINDSEFFNAASRRIIEESCAREISAFDYQWKS
jgi:hypothetical protein